MRNGNKESTKGAERTASCKASYRSNDVTLSYENDRINDRRRMKLRNWKMRVDFMQHQMSPPENWNRTWHILPFEISKDKYEFRDGEALRMMDWYSFVATWKVFRSRFPPLIRSLSKFRNKCWRIESYSIWGANIRHMRKIQTMSVLVFHLYRHATEKELFLVCSDKRKKTFSGLAKAEWQIVPSSLRGILRWASPTKEFISTKCFSDEICCIYSIYHN